MLTMKSNWSTILCIILISISSTKSINCYDCEYKLKPGENFKLTDAEPCFCLNDKKTNTSRQCQRHEQACFIYEVRRNGIITNYRRNCVEKCEEGCTYEGFGYLDEKCTFCCNVSNCNDAMAGKASWVRFNQLSIFITLLTLFTL